VTEPSPWLSVPPYGLAPHVIERLTRLAEEVALEWGLRLGPRIESGRYSYVALAGGDAVLKLLPVEDDQAAHIAEALEFWDGDGAVRLLRHDPARRALLLERVRPGSDASLETEDAAIAAALAVGSRIWRRPPARYPFRTIETLVTSWLARHASAPLIATARSIFERMAPRADVLVHADLHHYNLLRRGNTWVAIDPQPHVGEPEFDIPSFLWNPLFESVATPERTRSRIASFAAAGLDAERIRQWTIVRGITHGTPDTETDESPQLRVVRHLL